MVSEPVGEQEETITVREHQEIVANLETLCALQYKRIANLKDMIDLLEKQVERYNEFAARVARGFDVGA